MNYLKLHLLNFWKSTDFLLAAVEKPDVKSRSDGEVVPENMNCSSIQFMNPYLNIQNMHGNNCEKRQHFF